MQAGACRPRVLGMTASPIDQKSGKKSWGNQFFFKELEGNLDCKASSNLNEKGTHTDVCVSSHNCQPLVPSSPAVDAIGGRQHPNVGHKDTHLQANLCNSNSVCVKAACMQVYTVRDRSSIAQAVPLPTESQLMYPAEALHSRCQDAKGA